LSASMAGWDRSVKSRRRRAIALILAFSTFAAAVGAAPAPPAPSVGGFEDAHLFGEADLQALIAKNPHTGHPVDSIEELVPLLPKALRGNFTFVYDSRSPFHDSISPLAPRVVMFTDDARLVLTFTGDPAKPGYNLLETMTFDDDSASFRFRAYLLPAGARGGWRPDAAASDCTACHGKDPRPIYDSYPLWPGFYGSVLDTFFNDRLGRRELANYRAFLAGPAKTGVYRTLLFRPGSSVTPYLDPKTVHHHTVELDPKGFPFVPDARLGMALTELNRKRIYRKLAAAPGFAGQEKRLLAELLDCRGAPKPSRALMNQIYASLVAENAARLKRLGGRPSDPNQVIYGMEELEFVEALSAVDDVARRAGADRSDWSMAMEPGSLSFFDGILSGIHKKKSYYMKEDLIIEILDHLRQRDPSFAPYFSSQLVYARDGYPFGERVDLGPALAACPALMSGGKA